MGTSAESLSLSGDDVNLAPLLLLSRRHDIMGAFVNNRATNLAAVTIAGVIIALNLYLLWDTFL